MHAYLSQTQAVLWVLTVTSSQQAETTNGLEILTKSRVTRVTVWRSFLEKAGMCPGTGQRNPRALRLCRDSGQDPEWELEQL